MQALRRRYVGLLCSLMILGSFTAVQLHVFSHIYEAGSHHASEQEEGTSDGSANTCTLCVVIDTLGVVEPDAACAIPVPAEQQLHLYTSFCCPALPLSRSYARAPPVLA